MTEASPMMLADSTGRCNSSPGRSTTGVSPRGAHVLPCTESARKPDSSQKKEQRVRLRSIVAVARFLKGTTVRAL